ncbi:MAG TPA: hypothetical protein VIA62_02555 [Thermoanaerobaculia bacterium]|jgi:hypothetical protein|nr:hypothetical protein [Thermoanaerobaculia bacterium]
MANCTSTGFSGTTGFAFSGQNILPSGKVCVLSGYVQSAATQTVTVTSSTGTVVAQVSGTGGATGSPVTMTGKTNAFTADGNTYTITFTNNGGQTSRVLSANDNIAIGSTTYAASWIFITEDSPNGGDCDFNDTTAYLTWNLLKG